MLLAVGLALAAAVCIGTSDFFAGIVGRRDPSNSALVAAFTVVLVAAMPVAALVDGRPAGGGLGLGAAMGLFWAIGVFALARGIAFGRVVVVIPVAGLLSAAIPVFVDLLSGGAPGPMVGAGVVTGMIAVTLTGIGPDDHRGDRSTAWSVTLGAIGGVTTGISLVLMDRAADSGLWPLVTAAFVAAAATAAVLLARGLRAMPRKTAVLPAVAMGLLIAAAFVAMMLAFPRGSLTVVSVVVSQYPAVTILLAALVWRQRPRGVQYLGIGLTLVAVALIATG